MMLRLRKAPPLLDVQINARRNQTMHASSGGSPRQNWGQGRARAAGAGLRGGCGGGAIARPPAAAVGGAGMPAAVRCGGGKLFTSRPGRPRPAGRGPPAAPGRRRLRWVARGRGGGRQRMAPRADGTARRRKVGMHAPPRACAGQRRGQASGGRGAGQGGSPPVEMWLILAATPAFSTAATESPPPMMVMQPLGVSSASLSAMDWGGGRRGAGRG